MNRHNAVPSDGGNQRKILPPLKPRIRSGLSAVGLPRQGGPSTRPSAVRQPLLSRTSGKLHSSGQKVPPSTRFVEHFVSKGVQQPQLSDDNVLYFAVLYTKRSKKKHKTYQDGYLILRNDRKVDLLNEDGKKISTANFGKPLGGLKDGNSLEIGTFELEVQHSIQADVYLSGRLFLQDKVPEQTVPLANAQMRKIHASKVSSKFKPLRQKNGPSENSLKPEMAPQHDPKAHNAIVLQPSYVDNRGKNTVPIVLDPYLSKRMRSHQHEGVKFLYRCVEGGFELGESVSQGAILADSMGLGKSLQAIAIVWTLLKQGSQGKPLVRKAIIVCPASLVQNWMNEVKKWLGFERLSPAAVMSGQSAYASKETIANFLHGNVRKLLIISYEMFRSYAEDLYKVDCGVLICDEGHRLKSSGGNKTIAALNRIPCRRRIILTGTPVQNNLEEFFAMCNFVNPGALGTLMSFRTVFAGPIHASRDTNATSEAVALGKARGAELHKQAAKFVLRRTSNVLEKYLPPKTETAVFCHLSETQASIYENECERFFTATSDMSSAAALRVINRLRKICSHPALLSGNESDDESEASLPLRQEQKEEYKASSKMSISMSICKATISVGDRLVIVSNFTSTLDVLQEALRACGIKFCRLDGSTPAQARGDLVRVFNAGRSDDKVFLLSAKAGGVGLNIIGANRLILYDPDWNPATDLQAMARIWRDGQPKSVFVYRLLCTGTIEEKIYQRQLFKGELQVAIEAADENAETNSSFAQTLVANHAKGINFSAAELRDLFNYAGNDTEFCNTLEVLERSREDASHGGGEANDVRLESDLLNAFARYRAKLQSIAPVTGVVPCDEDDVLSQALNGTIDAAGIVSYLYTTRSGNHAVRKRKASPLSRANKPKQKKIIHRTPIIGDSESEASDDELEHLINGKASSKVLKELSSNIQERKIHEMVELSDGHEGGVIVQTHSADLALDKTPKEIPGLKLEAVGQNVGSVKQTAPQSSGITWDEVLDNIDGDMDSF